MPEVNDGYGLLTRDYLEPLISRLLVCIVQTQSRNLHKNGTAERLLVDEVGILQLPPGSKNSWSEYYSLPATPCSRNRPVLASACRDAYRITKGYQVS